MYKIIAEDLRMLRSLTSSYNGQRRNTNHASYYVLLLELTRLLRISYKLWAYAFHVRELHLYSSSLILEWYLCTYIYMTNLEYLQLMLSGKSVSTF